jgi:putative acetyltransferase
MIREFKNDDINSVMQIWLMATIDAHRFIPEEYWLKNYTLVKEMYVPSSKTFIYEENGQNKGFISIINDTYIGALFVDVNNQGNGIGTSLMDFAKKRYKKLSLAVYKENQKSLHFYQKAGFIIENEQINEDSGAKEFVMSWSANKS